MTVSVVIPTFRRPAGLRLAVQSVLGQSRLPDEIVVVDNSPEACALHMTRTANAIAKCPVRYVHEPSPGVSNARNAGWAAATGRFIAFLDDDEIAGPDWLSCLMETAQALDANIVFGPLRGDALEASGLRGALARRLYSRIGPAEDCLLDKPYGCGSSLIDRAAFDLPAAPFDPQLNATGGEDDAFFALLARRDARFAWSAGARGIETVGPERTGWGYLLARSFAFGQGATQNCWRGEAANAASVAYWMAVGLGQAAVFGLLAVPALLLGEHRAAALIDKAVQGVGKVFWIERFEPRFYGEAAPT